MRFQKLSACLLAFGLVLPCTAQASTIQARSEVAATVIMDGTPMGTTPMNITQVAPGDHEIAFQALGTRVMRAYRVHVPYDAEITTTVAADFVNQAPVVVEAMPIVAAPPVICAQPVIVRPRVVAAPVIVRPVVVKGRGYRGNRRFRRF